MRCVLIPNYVFIHCMSVCTQSCLTLCNPVDYSLRGCPVHAVFPGKNTGLPFPTPGNLPEPGIKLASPVSLASAGRFFTTALPETSHPWYTFLQILHTHSTIKISVPLYVGGLIQIKYN